MYRKGIERFPFFIMDTGHWILDTGLKTANVNSTRSCSPHQSISHSPKHHKLDSCLLSQLNSEL